MVLLEIDKAYPEYERLLGEHRWIEFLKNPRADENANLLLFVRYRASCTERWYVSIFPLLTFLQRQDLHT